MAPESSICNLPTEVLELVLKETGGKEELKKNCFVSQRFRDIAQGLLFKKVTVRYNDVIPITKLFVLRKDLAKSLQYLTVVFNQTGPPALLVENFRFAREVRVPEQPEGTFMHAASKILSGKVDAALKMFWLTELGKNQPDAHLALFLTILRAVKTADIQINDIQDHRMSFLELALNTVAKTYATTPAGEKPRYLMGMLEKLTIMHASLEVPCSSLGALFTAPCLQNIDIDGYTSPNMSLDILPKRTKITNIELNTFHLEASFLSALVRASPRLTNFIVSCGMPEQINNWLEPVCDAISERASTIEILALLTTIREGMHLIPIHLESLTNFRRLKVLDIPEALLLGCPPQIEERSLFSKTLPSSLQRLRLSSCTSRDLEPLASIADAGRDAFPDLQLICMDFGRVADQRDESVQQLIKDLVEVAKSLENSIQAHLYWEIRTLHTPAADAALEQFFEDNV
ncbi:hypothetical protein SLS54_004705 [Diplodia seriata]